MKTRIVISILFTVAIFIAGCATVPRQVGSGIDPEWLVGEWESASFEGLCAGDFVSETFEFFGDGTFSEETYHANATETSLDGSYTVTGSLLELDDGRGYSPTIPFYLENDTLIITRRANIGHVKVTFIRVGADSGSTTKAKKLPFEFTIDHEVKRTSVKSQNKTGTCWCFATISLLEAEAIRNGSGELDLSEMFVVRNVYPHKARSFVRLHGQASFSEGALSHHTLNSIKNYGIVPDNVYPGKDDPEAEHSHGDMVEELTENLKKPLKRSWLQAHPNWIEEFTATVDSHLGSVPAEFDYNGKQYTPETFRDEVLRLNMDDYITLVSFEYYPFYEKCRYEAPDNWDFDSNFYNVPIDDLEEIADRALKNGYSFAWGGDVGERGHNGQRGFAIVTEDPDIDTDQMESPVEEKEITQQGRQDDFDDYSSTDDHSMHTVGLAHDQNGTKYYLTKNSGETDNEYKGYLYLSRSYFRSKILHLVVHKDALSSDMAQKLGLSD